MGISHLLEDFSTLVTGSPVVLTDIMLEERRLEAFESGYRAGWDDSVKAQTEDNARVSTDLAQSLHELSFTYQEAYAAVLTALEPLMRQMVDVVLPHAAQETLGARLVEMLHDMAAEIGRQPVEIAADPGNLDVVKKMLSSGEQQLSMPVTVVAEPTLGSGQVFLRAGATERGVDLKEVLAEIDRAVTGFIEQNQKDVA